MSRAPRDSTTPMDYEYHNKTGPVDESSPFVTAFAAKKRPHSVLDSPSKGGFGGFNTPNRPQLREPDGKHYLFSQDNKPLPAVPSHIQSAWEPRTPASVIDFSSGGETPNTPAQDSDAATPDTSMASKMGRLMGGNGDGPRSKSPKKPTRRESWLGRMFSSSPSPSKEDSKFYSKKAENRVMKRRSKNRKANLRDEYDSDDSRPNTAGGAKGKILAQSGYARQAGDFFSWVEAHPHLPSVLSFWFQLLVNSILGLTCLYFIYTVWAGIQADVNIEASKYEAEIMKEIAHCFRQYNDNRCDPGMRVPAMENACGNWEACMKRDPKKIAKASVTAKTFAGIFNAFVEEFSYKSMLFTAIVIFGGFNLSNWAFGIIRSKQQQHQQNDYYPPPPATPHRQPSGGYIDQQGYYTAYHTPYGTMNQQMLQQATQSMPALLTDGDAGDGTKEDVGTLGRKRSPTKRRLFA